MATLLAVGAQLTIALRSKIPENNGSIGEIRDITTWFIFFKYSEKIICFFNSVFK